ncbi:DUF1624 domain-containing protein [Rhodoferax sediminis]|uniref:DUF1624 domain-containing protein n=1 Tax=Rhodoferax sediminis TaxID=2509614 RepID=A0A515DB88_9BURK|nr:heparan-alpha-glucosaminide N-acetyltransferase [Rhodoferax sediminis]QDL37659.1 DUF1624 domain-containing protein [Rhodoferax sediminis]
MNPAPISPTASRHRFDGVDALRGCAIVWMTVFHFCFDLNHFGYLRQNFYADPFWTWQRTAIVSLFLFCAGLGQAIAVQQGQSWPRFWKRWAQVAGCAVLVTAGSWWMFPDSFIYFGVLHGIAVMLIVVRLSAPWGRRHPLGLWLLGALAIASRFIAAYALGTGALAHFAEIFNARSLNWLGLITRKPITEDYVPVLPWLGVMCWGMACGQWLFRARPHWLGAAIPRPAAQLAWLGRWSLSWYMLHQPVLIGLVALAAWVAP